MKKILVTGAGGFIGGHLVKELLNRGRKTTRSHVKHLAGHMEKENIYEDHDKQWFVENFSPYFIPYFKKLQDVSDPNYYYAMNPFKEVWLATLWINFMKAGEFSIWLDGYTELGLAAAERRAAKTKTYNLKVQMVMIIIEY